MAVILFAVKAVFSGLLLICLALIMMFTARAIIEWGYHDHDRI